MIEQRNIAFTQLQAGFVAPVPTSDGAAATNANRQPLDP